MTAPKTRNHNIDVLKLLCAFFVVIIHSSIFLKNEIFIPIVSCAVPCFFIISGFFIFDADRETMTTRVKRSIKHLFFILLWSNLIIHIPHYFITHKPWDSTVIFNLLLFNSTPHVPLWYLFAYMYVLIIVYLTLRWHKIKWLKTITPILLLGSLLLGSYCKIILGFYPHISWSRNFLFCGIPFFMIGCIIKEHFKYIESIKQIQRYCIVGFITIALLAILEEFILYKTGQQAAGAINICTPFLAITLFLSFATAHRNESNWLSRLGEQDSLYIYIFHSMVIRAVAPLGGWCNIAYQYYGAIIIFILTIILIKIVRWCWNKISPFIPQAIHQ